MAGKDYAQLMARYNAWQNEAHLAAIETLSEAERRLERGAFFGSIERTATHLLWGDQIWMSRFADTPEPEGGIAQSARDVADWPAFAAERRAFDKDILAWADGVGEDWFEGDLTWWSGAAGREVTRPKRFLVVHFFNHQTHHRGQMHTMLTAAGAKTADSDLFFMPGV